MNNNDPSSTNFVKSHWLFEVEEKELTPWYATMYVKEEYRKIGYSRILNEAILREAKNRGFKTVYLKTRELSLFLSHP